MAGRSGRSGRSGGSGAPVISTRPRPRTAHCPSCTPMSCLLTPQRFNCFNFLSGVLFVPRCHRQIHTRSHSRCRSFSSPLPATFQPPRLGVLPSTSFLFVELPGLSSSLRLALASAAASCTRALPAAPLVRFVLRTMWLQF